jgi:hypothetical protein
VPAALYYDNLPAFQELDHSGARHPDQGPAGAWAAQIHRAFEFAGVDQVNYMISSDAKDASQKMHGEAFAGRQVLADMHGSEKYLNRD